VAHACDPSYSGGRDQENQGSTPAWANSLRDPISNIANTKKRAGGVDAQMTHAGISGVQSS
jgi:hypothetical protein